MSDTNNKRAVVLIPAYKPDERLIDLTRELRDNDLDVLLVDDIMTTGTTIAKCASILMQNGANSVTALVFASDREK